MESEFADPGVIPKLGDAAMHIYFLYTQHTVDLWKKYVILQVKLLAWCSSLIYPTMIHSLLVQINNILYHVTQNAMAKQNR